MKEIVGLMLVGMLLFGLAGTAFASYRGMGLAGDRVMSMRMGSPNGVFAMGGGPGSGK
jgi:hypothetical protein